MATKERETLILAGCIHPGCDERVTYTTDEVGPGYYGRLTEQAENQGWVITDDGWLCPTHAR